MAGGSWLDRIGRATRSPAFVAAARAVNGAFFVTAAAYGFLSYCPFAYAQFIKPSVLPELTDFVRLSPLLFWLALLIALLTLMPALRSGSAAARSYIVASIVAGIAVSIWRPLAAVDNSARALIAGVVALVPPLWLAVVDHVTGPSPRVQPSDGYRAWSACALCAVLVWATYAVAVPVRLRQVIGVDLAPGAIASAMSASLVAHLIVFLGLFFAIALVIGVMRFAAAAGLVEYWSLVALLGVGATLVLYYVVCAALAFTGRDAWIASLALGTGLAAIWADIARIRARTGSEQGTGVFVASPAQGPSPTSIDALALFSAPIAGIGSRAAAACVVASLPFVAYALTSGVRQFDWNFLLQKLGVLSVWLATFAACYALVRRPWRPRHPRLVFALSPLVLLVGYQALPRAETRASADRYASVDPSFRLLRDVRTARSAETIEYYGYLRANTLVSSAHFDPIDVDFVKPLGPAPDPKPNIFLLVVDSLRRDYLAPYNRLVTFTPSIAKLAADSDVFDRAFTPYAGTFLAVQSMWSGGLSVHAADYPQFRRRDTLSKLLRVNDYVEMMTVDNVVNEFLPKDRDVVRLDRGRGTMQVDVCSTLGELESELMRHDRARPVFFWSLPQDVHLGILAHMTEPPGKSYPGFLAKAASTLQRADACIGSFVEFLQRERLYDNSIIILTADHGDLYGYEDRWGHANLLYPDVMRVPLIVHVPPRLRRHLAAGRDDVALLTDITPTLYRLLGYQPALLGPTFGRPLFVDGEAELAPRRQEDFLLASAYGAVYGVLRDNGRVLYVVDTMEGREYAADMTGDAWRVGDAPPDVMMRQRQVIRTRLDALAQLFHLREPAP